MKKLILAGMCVMLLAACGGGENNASGGSGSDSGCSAEEAPELKGLEGAEKEAMQGMVAFRDKLKDLQKRAEAASEEEKKALLEEFDGMEKDLKPVDDKIEALSEEGKKKFETIKKEVYEIADAIEDALKPQ